MTLHHLLTHTAGFEEAVVGMLVQTRGEAVPLADYISEYRPERVYPPGKSVAYSNYGYSLAGLSASTRRGSPSPTPTTGTAWPD